MKTFLRSFISALFILPGSVSGQSSGQAGSPLPLKVMTFNIRYGTAPDGENGWKMRKDLVVRTIRAFDPDILGLQEALRFQLDEIGTALPGYTEIGVGRDDGKQAGEYAALLVRSDRFIVADGGTYWLSDMPEEPGSVSWGNTIPRICTWAAVLDRSRNMLLYVFNTHWDHESQESREQSAGLLLESIGHFTDIGDPVVVMGDLNAGEKNPAFLRLVTDERMPLTDVYRTLHPKEKNVATYHAFKGTTTGEKIDAILVSRELKVRSSEIVRTSFGGRYPSDHFPVTAVLTIEGE